MAKNNMNFKMTKRSTNHQIGGTTTGRITTSNTRLDTATYQL